jgi:hypothetical protein
MKDYLNRKSPLKSSSSQLSKMSIVDKPLTFNSRIKSSGYNNTPNSLKHQKFTPNINNKSFRSSSVSNLQNLEREMMVKKKISSQPKVIAPFKFKLPISLSKKVVSTDGSSPIINMKYSGNFCYFHFKNNFFINFNVFF